MLPTTQPSMGPLFRHPALTNQDAIFQSTTVVLPAQKRGSPAQTKVSEEEQVAQHQLHTHTHTHTRREKVAESVAFPTEDPTLP
jgi:hypothetical protein